MSDATIRTYRDTWTLFLAFLTETVQTPAFQLNVTDIDADSVLASLDQLETQRDNSVSTRNLRLASIKSTMAFYATRDPERLNTVAQIQAIPIKRKPKPTPTFLTAAQTQALLESISTTTWTGRRDLAMFTLATQTGLRLSELTGLRPASLHLGTGPHVACTGKGRKSRTTPMTAATTTILKTYLQERLDRPGDALFPNPQGRPLSPDAIGQRLSVYLDRAGTRCPELADKHITVHSLRHTAAMRFLEAGIDTAGHRPLAGP